MVIIAPGIGYTAQSGAKLVIYYFHRTVRCPSCILLEDLTRYAVNSSFNPEIENGQLELKVINIDEPNNSNFENHYNLSFQSVIVSKASSGVENKWKNFTQIWEYLHEEDKFMNYLQREIRLLLNECKGAAVE